MLYKSSIKVLFFLGLFLISVNIFNIIFPNDYRNDPYLINGYFSKENKKILNYLSEEERVEILEYKEAIKKFDKMYHIYGESLKFLNEATKIYFISKIPTEYSWNEKYTKVKFQENWIIYFFRIFEEIQNNLGKISKYKNTYIYYQSSDYKFALKRGISICSQDAISFANLLKRRYKLDYNIVALDGHVVMQAKIKDKYYLSDPNMGLTFNFSINEYYDNNNNILKIKNAYTNIGRPDLIAAFDLKGNRKFEYTGPKVGKNTYNPDTITFFSNYMKWFIPIFLIFISFLLKYKNRIIR